MKKLNEFLKHKTEITAFMKEYVIDQSIPLKTRWKAFCASGLGDIEDYMVSFDSITQDQIMGDYTERHQFIDMLVLASVGEEYIQGEFSQESKDALKEELMQKFIIGFRWDW